MVHRGAEGIGKSFFAETLAMLMGRYYVKITDFDQIFGHSTPILNMLCSLISRRHFGLEIAGLRAGLRIIFLVRRASLTKRICRCEIAKFIHAAFSIPMLVGLCQLAQ